MTTSPEQRERAREVLAKRSEYRADLVGQRFSRLTVVGTEKLNGKRGWLCACDCGGQHVVATSSLRSGECTNCGCERSARRKAASLKHGQNRGGKRTKEYRAWAHLVGRCTNPSDGSYGHYGARGITVCDAWLSFDNFIADMGPAPSPLHSIDRINNSRGYSPDNCRWATRAEQARNTRRTIVVAEGVCLKDACAERGVSYQAAQMRLRRGATMEQALSPLTGYAYRELIRG